jgi:hypothetical protein
MYAYSRTMAGAQRLAEQRGRTFPAIEPLKPKPAPAASPVASNVVRLRRPPTSFATRRLPSGADFSRAKHLEFLAGLEISTQTPVKLLIERVAAWHGFTYIDIIRDCRQRKFFQARLDCIVAVKLAYPEATQPWLGKRFCRDSTTMFYALRKRGFA